jgi:hypothetical protein
LNNNRNWEKVSLYFAGTFVFIALLYVDIFLLTIFTPIFIAIIVLISATSKEKNEYYKAKQFILLSLVLLSFLIMSIYFIVEGFFTNPIKGFPFILTISFLFVLAAGFLWMNKRAVPVSFLADDDRLIQETMYEDEDYTQTLQRAYAYRGTVFLDDAGSKIKPNQVSKAKGNLIPLDLTLYDVETIAVDKSGHLKSFYQDAVLNLFTDLVLNEGKKQTQFERYYGYCFTVDHSIKSEKEFAEKLKEESLFYYKIYEFLKKDCDHPQVKVKFNFQAMYLDNLRCLELTLMLMIHMTRQYMNLPTGNFAKYSRTKKDKQFLGAFSSMPSDFYATGSTSVAPAGVAYYYAYYAIHTDGFKDIQGTMKRYVVETL